MVTPMLQPKHTHTHTHTHARTHAHTHTHTRTHAHTHTHTHARTHMSFPYSIGSQLSCRTHNFPKYRIFYGITRDTGNEPSIPCLMLMFGQHSTNKQVITSKPCKHEHLIQKLHLNQRKILPQNIAAVQKTVIRAFKTIKMYFQHED